MRLRALACRRAAEENFARRRAEDLAALCALAHADSHRIKLRHAPPEARGGMPCRDAGLQTSRPLRQSARQMSRKPSLEHEETFAWVSKGALGTKLARPGVQGCLPQGYMTGGGVWLLSSSAQVRLFFLPPGAAVCA